jgi:WD40 repeat protein
MRRNAVYFITTILLSSLASSILNEKTFIIGDKPVNIQWIAVYGDSLLSAVFSDIIQRDIKTGAIQRTLRGHTDYIFKFLVTSDSRMITTGYDDYVIVWDLLSATVIRRIKLTPSGSKVTAIALKDDQIIIGGYDSRLRQIDLNSGEVVTNTSNAPKD